MKIISAEQTRQLDNYTILNEPIASIDLMERASLTFVQWFVTQFKDQERPIYICCGPGNNGGDGLAIARLLHHKGYSIEVVLCQIGSRFSEDYQVNLKRLPSHDTILIHTLEKGNSFPVFSEKAIFVDALFGSGLNRPVAGYWAEFLEYLNELDTHSLIAVDVPSGLFADQTTESTSLCVDYTFSFELPKLAFFIPENGSRVGEWIVESIGLNSEFIEQLNTVYHFLDQKLAKEWLKPRAKFAHKGTFGHSLLICGSYGKVGAALLAGKACLRSGVGLVSMHVPQCAYTILQLGVPEAMLSIDQGELYFSQIPRLDSYKSVGIGCGLDKQEESRKALFQLLKQIEVPLVIDADALNIIAEEKWHDLIPKNSIITPHPKEFERLFGPSKNGFERIELARIQAKKYQIHIVLKGAHTLVVRPDGNCFFNGTGNPGMATGGSGDALTGVICGLLAQGYLPEKAASMGVFIHGLAGDLAAKEFGQEAMIAGDIVDFLGKAFLVLSTG